jgi:hypothetical protein
MPFVPVVILEVVECMVFPCLGFDHHPPVPLCGGLEEFLDLWRHLLVDQVIKKPKVILVVR